jgi:hypothetical protein
MTCSLRDVKKAIKLVEDVFERIENLDNLFTRLGLEIFINLSEEEKETIDASRESNDSLLDVIRILDSLKDTMKEEGGEDSEDDGGDDEVL